MTRHVFASLQILYHRRLDVEALLREPFAHFIGTLLDFDVRFVQVCRGCGDTHVASVAVPLTHRCVCDLSSNVQFERDGLTFVLRCVVSHEPPVGATPPTARRHDRTGGKLKRPRPGDRRVVSTLLLDVCCMCGATFCARQGRSVPLQGLGRRPDAAMVARHAFRSVQSPLAVAAERGLSRLRSRKPAVPPAPTSHVFSNAGVVEKQRSVSTIMNPRFPMALVHTRRQQRQARRTHGAGDVSDHGQHRR